jgi:hypothetical protein
MIQLALTERSHRKIYIVLIRATFEFTIAKRGE